MSDSEKPSRSTLKEAILQLEEPIVFRNLLHDTEGKSLWNFLDWDLNELAKKFGDLMLPFRIGYNGKTSDPQWEYKCDIKNTTLANFLKDVESLVDNKSTYYFDYKYMNEWFKDHPEILSSIDWQLFGFDKTGADSTLWIGSQGAHTNCHQDSYGCNLIAQIHGRKQWILFPPECGAMLQPIRIPYEESTIYSRFNFFSPSELDEASLMKINQKARSIILNPGEALLVPFGWWHYVESLDLTVSVNIWLPLARDCRSRLGEAIVKLLVNTVGQNLDANVDDPELTLSNAVDLVGTCIKHCNELDILESPRKKFKGSEWSAEKLTTCYPRYVSIVPILRSEELQKMLSEKRNRFVEGDNCKKTAEEYVSDTEDLAIAQMTKAIINAICHPDVIGKVTELLLNSQDINAHISIKK